MGTDGALAPANPCSVGPNVFWDLTVSYSPERSKHGCSQPPTAPHSLTSVLRVIIDFKYAPMHSHKGVDDIKLNFTRHLFFFLKQFCQL